MGRDAKIKAQRRAGREATKIRQQVAAAEKIRAQKPRVAAGREAIAMEHGHGAAARAWMQEAGQRAGMTEPKTMQAGWGKPIPLEK